MSDESQQPPFQGDQTAPLPHDSSFVFPDHMPDLVNRGNDPYFAGSPTPWTRPRLTASAQLPATGNSSRLVLLLIGTFGLLAVIGLAVAIWLAISSLVNPTAGAAPSPLVVATNTPVPPGATPTVATINPTATDFPTAAPSATSSPTVAATATSDPTAVAATATSDPTAVASSTATSTVTSTATPTAAAPILHASQPTGTYLCSGSGSPGYPDITLSNVGGSQANWSGSANDPAVSLSPNSGKLKAGVTQTVVLSGKATVTKLVVTFTSNGGNPSSTINCLPKP